MSVIALNKRAEFDYEIQEKYEAGLVLAGQEVKAIKNGQVSLAGSFVTFKQAKGKLLPEFYLTNAHISLYQYASNAKDYDPTRPRKLLLKKKEIKYLLGKRQTSGLTLVPLKIYTKHSLIKLEFGVGRGRKKFDKREVIKKREDERNLRRLIKTSKK